ncbi:MAG: GyrI-like domain-containing protein [Ginsengibacter sp.]
MNKTELEEITLIGLSLQRKTTNANGQSAIDCGNLWQEFEKENYAVRIPGKLSDEVLAVYHQYEGDYTKPYSYFIGCKVKTGSEVPHGLDSLIIPKGTYQKIKAKGKIPDCVANAWKEIWSSDIPRAYRADFEVYDERSRDWNNAEVEIFLSIKQ